MNNWDDYQSPGMQGQQQLQHQQVIEPMPIVSNHDRNGFDNLVHHSHVDTIAPLLFTDDVPSDEFVSYIEEVIQTL